MKTDAEQFEFNVPGMAPAFTKHTGTAGTAPKPREPFVLLFPDWRQDDRPQYVQITTSGKKRVTKTFGYCLHIGLATVFPSMDAAFQEIAQARKLKGPLARMTEKNFKAGKLWIPADPKQPELFSRFP